jgi:hydrogenase expression/formation protein HypE
VNILAPTGARRGGTLRDPRINMSHGSGGRAMRALIEDVFVTAFDSCLVRWRTRRGSQWQN